MRGQVEERMKLAIVFSWLNQYGGAERVLEVVHDMYPQAHIYTSVYLPSALPEAARFRAGCTASAVTRLRCPTKVCSSAGVSGLPAFAGSHRRRLPSSAAEASSSPDGEKTRAVTRAVWPLSVRGSYPLAACQSGEGSPSTTTSLPSVGRRTTRAPTGAK